jgi:quercetin dioxygenase-like cupin family protein
MELKKYRWSRDYESAEEELHTLFEAKKITAERWTAEEFQLFEPHTHEYDKKLWCAEGSIMFLVDGKRFSLQPGDALDLPANTMHEATAGITGCVCYEAQRTPPTLNS